MIKAVVRNGVVVPCDPLPADWQDGAEVEVKKAASNGADDLDRWMADVQGLANDMDPEDEAILEKSIRDVRQQARDLARKEAEKS